MPDYSKLFVLTSIGIGGAIGAGLRYFIFVIVPADAFPWGTITVNLVGSFLLGGLFGIAVKRRVKEWLKAGVGTGFCGGFTTMSTFSHDTILLLVDQQIIQALIYISINVFGGILLAYVGMRTANNLFRYSGEVRGV